MGQKYSSVRACVHIVGYCWYVQTAYIECTTFVHNKSLSISHCKEGLRWHKIGIFKFHMHKSGLAPYLAETKLKPRKMRNKQQTFRIFHTTNALRNITLSIQIQVCACACMCWCRLIDTNSWIRVKHEQNTDNFIGWMAMMRQGGNISIYVCMN